MNQSVHACMVPGGSCKLQELLRLAITNTALIQRQLQGPSFMTRSFPAMLLHSYHPIIGHAWSSDSVFTLGLCLLLCGMVGIAYVFHGSYVAKADNIPRVLVGVGVSVNLMYATYSSTGITVRLFWCMIAPSIYFVVLVAFGRYEVQGGAQTAKGRQPSGNSHLDRMRDTREELLSSGECASSSGATCGLAADGDAGCRMP